MLINGYEVILKGIKRYYVEDLSKLDLSERDRSLDNTTPYLLKINDYEIKETTWVDMLTKLAIYLQTSYPKSVDELLNFKTDWSKVDIFLNQSITNSKKIDENLYINCNHTAIHSCWVIQDILNFYGIDFNNVKFLIHRTAGAEPKDTRDYFTSEFKKEFSSFLVNNKQKTLETAQIIISGIEKRMNPILDGISKSYNSFFLFDDVNILAGYSSTFIKKIDNSFSISEKNKNVMKKYIKYLKEFYKLKEDNSNVKIEN